MIDQEDLSINGTAFSFGSMRSTEIIKLHDEISLPYNPFTFDLRLKIVKSIEPYESNMSFIINSGFKSVFGRKKQDVEHILMAPTVSSKHFAIDENNNICDLGSTKGTFLWVLKDKPVEFDKGKIFLIGKTELLIEDIILYEKKIVFTLDNKTSLTVKKENPILIGSHKKCHLKIEGKEYYAAIDTVNMRLYTFLEDDDYDCEKGVWERLSGPKKESEGRLLKCGDFIMVLPYIFKVEY